MHLKLVVAVGLLCCGLATGGAAPAFAQGASTVRQGTPADRQLDVSRLPIDVTRIQRQLQQETTIREERDGLNLRYQIEVFGRAPQIRLFTPEDNLTTGPVPYGAPTHREVVEHITPREFRSPRMDINNLFRWLADRAKR